MVFSKTSSAFGLFAKVDPFLIAWQVLKIPECGNISEANIL